MPQLFSSILENQHLTANATTVCELLTTPENLEIETSDCSEHQVNGQVYINAVVIGLATALGYLISGYLIKFFGKKWLISKKVFHLQLIFFPLKFKFKNNNNNFKKFKFRRLNNIQIGNLNK